MVEDHLRRPGNDGRAFCAGSGFCTPGVRALARSALGPRDLEALDGPGKGEHRAEGQVTVHAVEDRPHWTCFGPGDRRSIAPSGPGKNTGPTTLTFRLPGGGRLVVEDCSPNLMMLPVCSFSEAEVGVPGSGR